MRSTILLTAGLVLAGCLPLSPAADESDVVELAPGTEAQRGDAFHVSFGGVKSDTRCPIDVNCPWEGDAVIEIGVWVGMGPTHPFELSLATDRAVVFAGYEIVFLSLSPEKKSDETIDPESYRARFRVRPAAGWRDGGPLG